MAGRAEKKRPRKGARPATKRASRTILGNDPFERGAAPRPTSSRTSIPTPPATAAAHASNADLVPKIDRAEARIAAALESAESRLAATIDPIGATRYARELRELVARLLPALGHRLRALSAVGSLFDGAGPLDAYGMDPLLFERAEPILDFLYGSWWRVEGRFIERVPSEGPAIVVANHGGALPWDALVLHLALRRDHPSRRELRPLLDDRALQMPLVGRVVRRLGAVAATPESAERLLRDGKVIAVFPEGSRAGQKPWGERYRLRHFGRGGFVKIALRTGAPIIPCAIVGSEEASPAFTRSGWLAERLGLPFLSGAPALPLGPAAAVPLPSKWSVRFADPIETRSLGPSAAEDPTTVNVLAERVRGSIQSMLDEDVAGRKSVFL